MATKATRLPDYVPDTITDKSIHDFLHTYYDTSNDGQAHDDYADFFTKDGQFIFNDKKAKGRDEILKLRKAIWSHVPGRDHYPLQIYTHGSDPTDLMVYGIVTYDHHHGHQTEAEVSQH